MAISPTSDLILDVARAADPQKALAATRALNSASAGGDGAGFASTLAGFSPSLTRYGYHNPSPTLGAAETPAHKAAVGLESVLLKNFVDQMLPKDAVAASSAKASPAMSGNPCCRKKSPMKWRSPAR